MKDQEEIIKHFIKEMSNELGDMNESIVRISADCYQKELGLARKMKVHLVKGFNLLVQLEKAIDKPKGSSCRNPYLLEGKELEDTIQKRVSI